MSGKATFAQLLKPLANEDSPIGKMITKAAHNIKVQEQQERAIRAKINQKRESHQYLGRYLQRIKDTQRNGLGSLKPCDLKRWKPGKAALANGKPCRIKWALSDGTYFTVVVSYEFPQPLAGNEGHKSHLALVPLASLTPCNCRGYIHKRGCEPK